MSPLLLFSTRCSCGRATNRSQSSRQPLYTTHGITATAAHIGLSENVWKEKRTERKWPFTVTRSSRWTSLLASICISTLVANVGVNWCTRALRPVCCQVNRLQYAMYSQCDSLLCQNAPSTSCGAHRMTVLERLLTRPRSRSSDKSLTSRNRYSQCVWSFCSAPHLQTAECRPLRLITVSILLQSQHGKRRPVHTNWDRQNGIPCTHRRQTERIFSFVVHNADTYIRIQ